VAGRVRSAAHATRVAASVFALVTASLTAQADELSEAEQRGKQIYFEGTSPRGTEITAVVGDEGAFLPGSAMPCSSCHGSDGLGRPEGGVIPLDIRWSELVKTYGHVHHDDRRHPSFDDDSFNRSIIAGVDPGNNQLDRSMPIYQLSDEDMADLVAYMKVLENDLDPGISDDAVRVATLLPMSGRAWETGDAMRIVLEGYFNDINEAGGVFGRRIELMTVPMGETPEASLAILREAFASEGFFALVGAYTVGLDEALLTYLRSDNVPLVGPFTLDPGDAYFDAAAFYLYAGLDQQARVLADRAIADGAAVSELLIAGPSGARLESLTNSASAQVRAKGGESEPVVVNWEPGSFDAAVFADNLASAEGQALLFFGAQAELETLLAEFAKRGEAPRIYLLSSLMARPLTDLSSLFDGRAFLAYPTLATDVTARGRDAYQKLATTYSLPREHIQAQLAAFAAAQLFVEGLRKAGRDLSRVKLVEGLESLYQFDTGVTPPLSFGPNRRIGARGAHVLVLDVESKTFKPVGDGWFDVK
jgi:ABC-type branched-subunit amino acid transport system substrate-binding protein